MFDLSPVSVIEFKTGVHVRFWESNFDRRFISFYWRQVKSNPIKDIFQSLLHRTSNIEHRSILSRLLVKQ